MKAWAAILAAILFSHKIMSCRIMIRTLRSACTKKIVSVQANFKKYFKNMDSISALLGGHIGQNVNIFFLGTRHMYLYVYLFRHHTLYFYVFYDFLQVSAGILAAILFSPNVVPLLLSISVSKSTCEPKLALFSGKLH